MGRVTSERQIPTDAAPLDLRADPVELARRLIDIPSPSHHEGPIADAIEQALRGLGADLWVRRLGNTVVARTDRGLSERVVLAGHVDTVPIADNVPHRAITDDAGREAIFGCGAVDMKTGLAVYLHAFAALHDSEDLKRDLTLVAYEAEEVDARHNGLRHVAEAHPEWLAGDIALLGEPSEGIVEAGCQGSIRLKIDAAGTRAHSARAWLGDNAIHRLAPVLAKTADYEPREAVEVGGCTYREGLNVVGIEGGVATNVIPDEASLLVNFRYAPDREANDAMDHLVEVLGVPHPGYEPGGEATGEGLSVRVEDFSGAAAPGLDEPAAASLLHAVGGEFRAKYGWTDVSRFGELGIPAVNLGCGDPGFAHKRDEQCPTSEITGLSETLSTYLTS